MSKYRTNVPVNGQIQIQPFFQQQQQPRHQQQQQQQQQQNKYLLQNQHQHQHNNINININSNSNSNVNYGNNNKDSSFVPSYDGAFSSTSSSLSLSTTPSSDKQQQSYTQMLQQAQYQRMLQIQKSQQNARAGILQKGKKQNQDQDVLVDQINKPIIITNNSSELFCQDDQNNVKKRKTADKISKDVCKKRKKTYCVISTDISKVDDLTTKSPSSKILPEIMAATATKIQINRQKRLEAKQDKDLKKTKLMWTLCNVQGSAQIARYHINDTEFKNPEFRLMPNIINKHLWNTYPTLSGVGIRYKKLNAHIQIFGSGKKANVVVTGCRTPIKTVKTMRIIASKIQKVYNSYAKSGTLPRNFKSEDRRDLHTPWIWKLHDVRINNMTITGWMGHRIRLKDFIRGSDADDGILTWKDHDTHFINTMSMSEAEVDFGGLQWAREGPVDQLTGNCLSYSARIFTQGSFVLVGIRNNPIPAIYDFFNVVLRSIWRFRLRESCPHISKSCCTNDKLDEDFPYVFTDFIDMTDKIEDDNIGQFINFQQTKEHEQEEEQENGNENENTQIMKTEPESPALSAACTEKEAVGVHIPNNTNTRIGVINVESDFLNMPSISCEKDDEIDQIEWE